MLLSLPLRAAFLLTFLILGSTSLPAQAQEVGRLFMTPVERAQLERLRQSSRWRPGGAGPVVAAPGLSDDDAAAAGASSAPSAPRTISLDGIVTRSSRARPTLWLDPHTAGAVMLQNGHAVRVRLPSGKTVILKPGQSVDAASGRVREAYAAGRASLP